MWQLLVVLTFFFFIYCNTDASHKIRMSSLVANYKPLLCAFGARVNAGGLRLKSRRRRGNGVAADERALQLT